VKIIIQIAAFNEEKHIAAAIEDVRNGFSSHTQDAFDIVVINDGSTDHTKQKAKEAGVDHIVDFSEHLGLGVAFKAGLQKCLELDADVIVNMDADLQYRGEEIHKLIAPIIQDEADMVIGDRGIAKLNPYPKYKRWTQTIGNRLFSKLFHTDIRDANSGFRAISKNSAELLIKHATNNYTYSIETLCLLLLNKKRVSFVDIHIRDPLRKSRLITSKIYYARNYLGTLFKSYRKIRE